VALELRPYRAEGGAPTKTSFVWAGGVGAAPTAKSSHSDITEDERSPYTGVAGAPTWCCLQAA